MEFHIGDENQITEIDAASAMMLTDPFKACNRWIRQIGWNTQTYRAQSSYSMRITLTLKLLGGREQNSNVKLNPGCLPSCS